MSGKVWIVIVNYRTAELVTECLSSIAKQTGELPGLRTVVVDNASGDGSVMSIKESIVRNGWQSWATLLPLHRNGGFAFGNNAGIRMALQTGTNPEYVMLLNPDTVACDRSLATLVDFLDSNPDVGIAGSLLENPDGSLESSAHNAPSPIGELESGARLGMLSRALVKYAVTPPHRMRAHECAWVSGASMMIRRRVFESTGLLDEAFFLYFEEADFCARARNVGWKIWFVPESRVVHMEGGSTGIQNTTKRRPPYWYDSRRRYFVKHFGISGLVLADALWAAGRMSLFFRNALRPFSRRNRRDPRLYAFDLIWGDVRSLLTGRIPQIRPDERFL
jgi:N-acetylglucosaminyl-diphospho-decaprenol L-rhamnosyltransferase